MNYLGSSVRPPAQNFCSNNQQFAKRDKIIPTLFPAYALVWLSQS